MKELTLVEMEYVAGAGWIQNGLAAIGGKLGDLGYEVVSNSLSIKIPGLGTISIGSLFPTLGEQIGKAAGGQIGGMIENTLSHLPIIGGLVNKVLCN